jgi:hypothetical protein
MKKLQTLLKRLPPWSLVLIEISLVVTIGYADYLIGDYSILIFYAIPVALASFIHGALGAISISVTAGFARYISDYYSYSYINVRYLSSIIDMLFLLIIGLSMLAIIRLLNEENNENKRITAANKVDHRKSRLAKIGTPDPW